MEKVTPAQLRRDIGRFCNLPNPPALMIFGNPGIGKTQSVRDEAAIVQRLYLTLSLGRLESSDIKGVPDITGAYTDWKAPAFWKQVIDAKGACIVHFDEFTLADDAVQGAVLDVVLNKMVDNLKLPEGTLFILSGNMGGDDGTAAHLVSSAFTGGRGFVYRMGAPTPNDWVKYQQPVSCIKEFVLAKGTNALYVGPSKKEPFEAWTCPRSWSQLDNLIKGLNLDPKNAEDIEVIIHFAKGILSPSTIEGFKEFVKDLLIDPIKLLAGNQKEWASYDRASTYKRAKVLSDVVTHVFDSVDEAQRVKTLQTFIDKLIPVEVPKKEAEILSGFFTDISDKNPLMIEKLIIEGKKAVTYLDSLVDESIVDKKKKK